MPPVLGPVSPSPTRLKSCAGCSGTTVAPSVTAKSETSGPSRYSSMTTRAARGRVGERLRQVGGHDDALAGGQAVVLHDVRRAELVQRGVRPRRGRAQASARAVGTPAAAITSLANSLEPSSRAAAADGPKQSMPRCADRVGGPGDQRRLGADDDQVGRAAARPGPRRPPGRRRRPAGCSTSARCRRCPGAQKTAVTAGSAQQRRAPARARGRRTADDEDISPLPELPPAGAACRRPPAARQRLLGCRRGGRGDAGASAGRRRRPRSRGPQCRRLGVGVADVGDRLLELRVVALEAGHLLDRPGQRVDLAASAPRSSSSGMPVRDA